MPARIRTRGEEVAVNVEETLVQVKEVVGGRHGLFSAGAEVEKTLVALALLFAGTLLSQAVHGIRIMQSTGTQC